MDMTLIARPIDAWPGALTPEHKRAETPFTADWDSTVTLLEREVFYIAGDSEIVLQLAVSEREIRNDGWINSRAIPTHPGVIISFTDMTTGQPLRFSTDHFTNRGYGKYLSGWKSNVRAIAKGLEHLRALERYGLGSGHEQYVGWQQIGSGEPMALGAGMTADAAARILLDGAQADTGADNVRKVISDRAFRREVYVEAQKRTHPDQRDGSDAASQLVNEARDVLTRYAP